jgi:hypothetical protein
MLQGASTVAFSYTQTSPDTKVLENNITFQSIDLRGPAATPWCTQELEL